MKKTLILLVSLLVVITFLYVECTQSKLDRIKTIFNIELDKSKVIRWEEHWSPNGDGAIEALLLLDKDEFSALKNRKIQQNENLPPNLISEAPVQKMTIVSLHSAVEDKVAIAFSIDTKKYLYCFYSIK